MILKVDSHKCLAVRELRQNVEGKCFVVQKETLEAAISLY